MAIIVRKQSRTGFRKAGWNRKRGKIIKINVCRGCKAAGFYEQLKDMERKVAYGKGIDHVLL